MTSWVVELELTLTSLTRYKHDCRSDRRLAKQEQNVCSCPGTDPMSWRQEKDSGPGQGPELSGKNLGHIFSVWGKPEWLCLANQLISIKNNGEEGFSSKVFTIQQNSDLRTALKEKIRLTLKCLSVLNVNRTLWKGFISLHERTVQGQIWVLMFSDRDESLYIERTHKCTFVVCCSTLKNWTNIRWQDTESPTQLCL